MDDLEIRRRGHDRALDFLTNSQDFRLGDIEAEQSHPVTRNMSDTFLTSVSDGLGLLAKCDELLAPKLAGTLAGTAYRDFEELVFRTLRQGGRIVLSGCGSSGRLCMRIENNFRKAAAALGEKGKALENAVIALQTGGDYAVIRAVESFEDFTALGRHQAEELGLTGKDLLIGVTATGETTSVLGTAARALDDGASVCMVVCSDPDGFYDRLPRAATVYRRPRSSVLLLPCGPMALTGSTRMQSSTYEQAVIGIAMDRVLARLAGQEPVSPEAYADAFAELTARISGPECIAMMAEQVKLEEACYRSHSYVTYFSDEYLLDVLTDTTERSPTFSTPPFVSRGMTGQEESWAFVKNPGYDTGESWIRCFRRKPRCIEWRREEFESLGLDRETVDRIPPIGCRALCDFMIGREPNPMREAAQGSVAVWVGDGEPPAEFGEQAARYSARALFTLEKAGLSPMRTRMDLFEHLGMKMILNTVSTATMVCMGRVTGNRMTFLNISNKKLVDRSARIISLFSGLSYEQALEELFVTEETLKQNGDTGHSATQETLNRLKTQEKQNS